MHHYQVAFVLLILSYAFSSYRSKDELLSQGCV